jgi:hypothetical protein
LLYGVVVQPLGKSESTTSAFRAKATSAFLDAVVAETAPLSIVTVITIAAATLRSMGRFMG